MPNVRADPGSSLVDWLWMGAGAPGVCMLDLFPGVLVSSLIGNKDLNKQDIPCSCIRRLKIALVFNLNGS